MECSIDGVATLSVTTVEGVVKLRTDRLDGIEFVSYTTAVKGDINCGPFPNVRVRINYRPDPSGQTLGTPLVVAFIE